MTSTAQSNANRANAQSSTGPTSEEGKKKSSLNSVTHGFTGQTLVLAPLEKEAYAILNIELTNLYAPVGAMEMLLVRRIIDNQFRVTQIHTTEAGVFMLGMIEYLPQLSDYEPEQAQSLARAMTMEKSRTTIDRLHRYERTIMRQVAIDKAELKELQATRKDQVETAATLAEYFESKGQPFDPAQFGFVLSLAEIRSYRDGMRLLKSLQEAA
jgi:hypothetical protein